MPRTRPPYPPEFRAEAVKLARSSGKLLSEVAGDLGVPTETLCNWLKQKQIDTGKRDGLTTDEREELKRLRRENKVLKEEREVLRKATAFSPQRRTKPAGGGDLLLYRGAQYGALHTAGEPREWS